MLRLGAKCYAWEVQKPLILLICYAVTLGKPFLGGLGGKVPERFPGTDMLAPKKDKVAATSRR